MNTTTMNTTNGRVISIEGNIGSGKSTLVEYLREHMTDNVVYVDEPVNKWDVIRDVDGRTILQKFYDNPKKYAFSFQIMALVTRFNAIRDAMQAHPDAIIITERSLYTDKLVFAKMLSESGEIEDVNYQIYLNLYDVFVVQCPIESIIYVKTEPTICRERITKRLRTGEEGIPITYLVNCDKYHDLMLSELQIPTLALDGNIDLTEEPDLLNQWKLKIENFIRK